MSLLRFGKWQCRKRRVWITGTQIITCYAPGMTYIRIGNPGGENGITISRVSKIEEEESIVLLQDHLIRVENEP